VCVCVCRCGWVGGWWGKRTFHSERENEGWAPPHTLSWISGASSAKKCLLCALEKCLLCALEKCLLCALEKCLLCALEQCLLCALESLCPQFLSELFYRFVTLRPPNPQDLINFSEGGIEKGKKKEKDFSGCLLRLRYC
jgi:hypothetical protein